MGAEPWAKSPWAAGSNGRSRGDQVCGKHLNLKTYCSKVHMAMSAPQNPAHLSQHSCHFLKHFWESSFLKVFIRCDPKYSALA